MRLLWFGEFLISLQWCVIRAPSAKLLLFYKLSLVEQTKVCYQHPGCKRKRLVPLLSCFPLTFSWHYLLRDLIWQDSFFVFFVLHPHCTFLHPDSKASSWRCDLLWLRCSHWLFLQTFEIQGLGIWWRKHQMKKKVRCKSGVCGCSGKRMCHFCQRK